MTATHQAVGTDPHPQTPLEVLHTLPAAKEPELRQLHIEFTGSGSEYFRIWIVNLLLTLVTLGLYLPWAKVRRLRYFYSNTLIDSDPVHFHGAPLQMFKGFAIVIAGFALYSLASEFSPTAGSVAFLVVAALWPLLFRSSMCFRLANTSWRGLRFAFAGSKKDAYLVWLPLLLPCAGLLLLYLVGSALPDPSQNAELTWHFPLAFGCFMLGSIGGVPWLLYRLKSYQHRNYCFSSETTVFTTPLSDYYGTALGCVFMVLLASIAFALGMLITGWINSAVVVAMEINKDSLIKVALELIMQAPLLIFCYSLVISYAVTRFQTLAWNGTHSQNIQFTSTLGFDSMMSLTVKNWLLTLLSLGLYWPYAKVAMTRLRLESVRVQSSIDPAQWVAASSLAQGSAMGDASGDFFGFDVGL
jgi:uncharacterized membrane protein YjgN (DUF898 family)